jgi:hypothetical protein
VCFHSAVCAVSAVLLGLLHHSLYIPTRSGQQSNKTPCPCSMLSCDVYVLTECKTINAELAKENCFWFQLAHSFTYTIGASPSRFQCLALQCLLNPSLALALPGSCGSGSELCRVDIVYMGTAVSALKKCLVLAVVDVHYCYIQQQINFLLAEHCAFMLYSIA